MLISKKELLAETGISYGQLYRWKREGLIPDAWFQKQSAYTGQETFFERELILKRVELILSLKDDHSLEEIRDLLYAAPADSKLSREQLESIAEAATEVAALFRKEEYSFYDLALMSFASELYRRRNVPLDEIAGLLEGILPLLPEGRDGRRLQVYRGGSAIYGVFTAENAELVADRRLEPVAGVAIDALIGELKLKYRDLMTGKDGRG